MRAAVARVCTRRRYHLRLRNKGYLMGSTNFCCRRHCFVEEIYVCLGEHTFDRHTACCTNRFGFYMRSYPPTLLRLLMTVGTTSGREKGEVNISCPLCVIALFPLAFGWLVLCGILLVACHMTSWQSMEFQKHQ